MASTENVRIYEDLPVNAQKYVELIEDKLGLPGNSYKSTIFIILYLFYFELQWDGLELAKIAAQWFKFTE